MTHTIKESGHHPVGSICLYTAVNTDTGRPQTVNTLPVNAAVRVLHGNHHTRHTGSNKSISASTSLSHMRTGLQRDIGTAAARSVTSHCQRLGLGMRAATACRMTHGNKTACLICNSASNGGVRAGSPFCTTRCRHSKLHPPSILILANRHV
jgi:hypothetical protein